MKTVETKNEGLSRAYTMTITAKDIEALVDKEVKAVAPQVKMPGFRPGKVPPNLVRKMHGEAMAAEALNKAIQDGVQKAIAANKLRPATQPEVSLAEGYAPGKDAQVSIALEVLPTFETPAVEGLKLERLTIPVADADIDAALEKIAAQQKSFEAAAKSYKAAIGDQVVIDFEGKVDGTPFEGGKGEAMAVELGSGQLIPGFEKQMIGLKTNDSKTLKVTFPDDYNAEHLKGKAAEFDIVVGEVRKPVTSKVDDAFAKSLGLEGIDQLKDLVKGQVEQEHNGLTRTHMKRKLLDTLAADYDFAVPPSMVEAEFDQIWQQLEHEASHEEDPAAARKEIETDRDDYRHIAERRVRLGLVLSQIGQSNGVEVSSQEMNRLIMQAAQQYRPEDREKFVQYVQQDAMAAAQLRAPLYEDKVVDYLFDKAEIIDKDASRAEVEAAIEAEEDSAVAKPAAKKPAGKKGPSKKAPAPKAPAQKARAKQGEAKPAVKKSGSTPGAKPAPAKTAAPAKEAPAKDKAPAKKPAAKKPAAKKPAAKK